MSDDNELARGGRLSREESGDTGVQVGQWYWMDTKVNDKVWLDKPKRKAEASRRKGGEVYSYDYEGYQYEDIVGRSLLCVTEIGSNYVKLTGVPYESQNDGRWHGWRVHFNEFASVCELEPNAKAIIDGYIKEHRANSVRLMEQVQAEMEKLGVVERPTLGDGASELSGTSTALAKSNGVEVKSYRQDLEFAKAIEIPHLFERIKWENKLQATWMKAEMLPLLGQIDKIKPIQEAIEARLLNVELYAGLVEEIVLVREGQPAAMAESVRLMQRMHFMDEECLANYDAGGMDYKGIEEFDAWLARDDNFSRILPFPRTVVSFRVRRYAKERYAVTYSQYVNMWAEQEADQWTFLYMRNGDRLYRISTKHDFGEQLFPDFDTTDQTSQLYFKRDGSSWCVIGEERLQGIREDEAAETERQREKFNRDKAAALAAGKKWDNGHEWRPHTFFYTVRQEARDYKPLNTDDVYYDDAMEQRAKQIRAHNRVAMVLQGIIDRSEVFHPHPRWMLWDADGFASAVTLVYDDSRALYAGEKPDFEAYRARVNATLTTGCYVTGQYDLWVERERKKEQDRLNSNYRLSYEQKRLSPYWRPSGGPDVVTKTEHVGKLGARFRWSKERASRRTWRSRDDGDLLSVTFTAKLSDVLNVSDYKPGDYKQFFADPRTRSEYIQWAPLLLAAEDWHAGKAKERKKRRR